MYVYIKNCLDFILAVFLLPLLMIIFIPVYLLIKSEDRGPIFYCAKRIGKHGKIFKMYKFRTMKVDAPDLRLEDGSTYNSKDDPRITNIGRILRKTSIDELPQIINILKGDMSFVGPRPDSAMYLDQYTDAERIILNVRPGITGYNQAINRNAVGTKEKLQNDIIYVENMRMLFDLKIIIWTIKSVISSKNVYRS